MTDHQRRSAQLVHGIRAALERGVSAERIHAELVRRNMPAEKAALLLDRIQSNLEQPSRQDVSGPVEDAIPAAIRHSRRHRRAPFFLTLAVMLTVGGFAGVVVTAPEPEPKLAVEVDHTARLTAETEAARSHITYLDSLLGERRTDAEQIEWLRARIAKGPESFQTPGGYRAMVAKYHRRREAWNRTLPDYQVITGAFRTLAAIHNAKIDSLAALKAIPPSADDAEPAYVPRRVRIVASSVR